MEAIRVHPNPDTTKPYSAENPAPPSALRLDSDVSIPTPTAPNELLVKIKATTVVRDALTWPETYLTEYPIPGNDFAGIVVAVNEATENPVFKPGDEVYGMTAASRAGTWSEYAIVLESEASRKPNSLSWAEAGAVPLSALTAYQALFEQAGLPAPNFDKRQEPEGREDRTERTTVLITGASGCVGLYLVRLARLAGLHVVAASRSNPRNKELLQQFGADEIVEYQELSKDSKRFEVIIDTVGGDVLKSCWSYVNKNGAIISIDSLSYDFVEEHRKLGLIQGAEKVKAKWFVVSPSSAHLRELSVALEAKMLEPLVACVMSLADAQSAYEGKTPAPQGRGKVVLTPRHDSTL